MDTDDKRATIGIGAAVAVCCAIPLIILAGGTGALGGIVGGLLSSPYLIIGGLALLTAAVAALALRRFRRNDHDEGESRPPSRGPSNPVETDETTRQ